MRRVVRSAVIPAILTLCLDMIANGQVMKPPVEQQSHMKEIEFLVGHWEGDGWIDFAPGQRRTFKETETLQKKLDGLVLVIEGVGRGPMGQDGREGIIHNAFAVVSWSESKQAYHFLSYESSGRSIDADAHLSNGAFVWGFPAGPEREIRFSIRLDDKGQWIETGEMSAGTTGWQKFFEMTLKRLQ